MINKIYILNWSALICGVFFLIIGIYTLFRNVKRDKIIAFSLFFLFSLLYIFTQLRISSFNTQAEIYFGTYQLKDYNNSTDFKIEIVPNAKYQIFNDDGIVKTGTWELSITDTSITLLIEGRIFGINELEVK